MTLDDIKGNILIILTHQVHIQWNIKMSPINCRDAIKMGMKEYILENTTADNFLQA